MKTLILISLLLSGCALPDAPVTKNHILAAEKLCVQNGGISSIDAPLALTTQTEQRLMVHCNNGAYFLFNSYKTILETKDANVQN